jgi:hypothetical protein
MDIQADMQHEHATWTLTCSMDMDMQHGHGDLVMQHRPVHAARIWAMNMHGCPSADIKLSPASLVFC